MLEAVRLTKAYGGKEALRDVSFTVERGHIYGLLGKNGAGKSTTMNILTGYLAPTSGSVTIEGIDLSEHPRDAKRHIGYLPELPPVYPGMTAEEYLHFAAELKDIPKAERQAQVEEAILQTGIGDVRHRLIRNLSKGYQQRVGIAQALLGNPDIIILDEPTVGLDPEQIIEIRELISGLREEHTVILSSHILSEISEVCDHVFILAAGRLVLSESMEQIASLEQTFIDVTREELE